MNKILILVVTAIAFLLGSIFTALLLNISAPNMLIKEVTSPYDFEKTVRIIEERINKKEGWHVVTTYDQNHEVIQHGGEPIGKMAIIKYCNGKQASNMLISDDRKKLSPMMPKGISVYEDSRGTVHIAMSNGKVMGKLFGGEVEKIIEEVSLEVEEIMSFMHFKFTIF